MRVSYGFGEKNSSIKQKIYSAEKEGIPYTVVLGSGTVGGCLSYKRRGQTPFTTVSFETFLDELKQILEKELL